MANDTILTPGGELLTLEITQLEQQYLQIDKYLSEFSTSGEKSAARENLDVYGKENVYTQLETNIKIGLSIQAAINELLSLEDPYGILPLVAELIRGDVKEDGSTPFLAPLEGVDPIQDYHLATKRFVNKVLKDHISNSDPHKIVPIIEDMLEQYVKLSEVYFKSQLYTKNEIDKLNKSFVKRDGSTSFTIALVGADPLIDSHLATKRYVDKTILEHVVDIDPHGFISLLNNRLSAYAKTLNVYDKSQTYSRVLIDGLIRSLVRNAAIEALQDHLNEYDPHHILDEVRLERYIKLDGTIPFKAPQKGVDAVDPLDLVTLNQVENKVEEAIEQIPEPIWVTSGPVQTTVGFIEDNSVLTKNLTILEIMDAIFYGESNSIVSPEYGVLGESVELLICARGSLANLEYILIFLDGSLIYTLTTDDFQESSCITRDSLPILEDTVFEMKVVYTDGILHSDTAKTKVSYPVFIGLLPKWKFGNVVSYELMLEMVTEDPINNKFYACGSDIQSLTHDYNFLDALLNHLFIALPSNYPDLSMINIHSQQFTKDACDEITMIPLLIPKAPKDVIYKYYIYRLALVKLNIPVTFKFTSNE